MIVFSEQGLVLDYISVWHRGDPAYASWDAEQFIESSPLDVDLIFPSMNWFRDRLTSVEMLHLNMMVRMRNDGEVLASSFPSLIGNPQPGILLLGDVHNPNNDPWYRASFGPWAGSGVWLLESLQTLSPELIDDMALANAGEDGPSEMVAALGNPSVVALGRNAERFCAQDGVRCGVAPHPQYGKRFLNSKRAQYAKGIVAAAKTGNDFMSRIGDL